MKHKDEDFLFRPMAREVYPLVGPNMVVLALRMNLNLLSES